ncbi:hypothetical protein OK016_23875 [Vibrio chagasii]|nr:hypothetical protein [Vibrio chagasii]
MFTSLATHQDTAKHWLISFACILWCSTPKALSKQMVAAYLKGNGDLLPVYRLLLSSEYGRVRPNLIDLDLRKSGYLPSFVVPIFLKPTTDMRGVIKGVLGEHLSINTKQLNTIFPDSEMVKTTSNDMKWL